MLDKKRGHLIYSTNNNHQLAPSGAVVANAPFHTLYTMIEKNIDLRLHICPMESLLYVTYMYNNMGSIYKH